MADNSIGQLISGLIGDLGHLVRQELRLAQAETSEKLQQAQTGAYAVVTGLLIAFCALLILLEALVIALSEVMPAWVASLSVGVALALIAFILIRQGSKSLNPKNLIPERTLRAGRSESTSAFEHRAVQGDTASRAGR